MSPRRQISRSHDSVQTNPPKVLCTNFQQCFRHFRDSSQIYLFTTNKNQCIESKITGTPRRFFNGISVTFHGVTHANQAVGIPSACANASGNLGYRWVREAQCRSGVNYGNSKKSRVKYIYIYYNPSETRLNFGPFILRLCMVML